MAMFDLENGAMNLAASSKRMKVSRGGTPVNGTLRAMA